MLMLKRVWLLFLLAHLATKAASGQDLPEGNAGIATRFARDMGIESDPAVVFSDDFEDHDELTAVRSKWDVVSRDDFVRIASGKEHAYRGQRSLEFSIPKGRGLALVAAKLLKKKRDVLFLRHYAKFDASFDVSGSSHNGCSISGGYFVDGYRATAGVPANGRNKFLAALENWRWREPEVANPGRLNVYIYHPLQRDRFGDHFFPTGTVLPNTSLRFDFGRAFVSRPDVTPKLDRWYCYELMLKANTSGKRDGRIACWLDGKLIADFPNLRLRDVDSLKIDRFQVGFHIGRNTEATTRKWYDNIVAATSYIGPMR